MSPDVQEAVEALPGAFMPEKAGAAQAVFQLDLSGDDGGQWALSVANGECEVREEVAPQPDATISMDGHDFVALISNQLDPVGAFMGGKIKIAGNLGMVMQFLGWFKRG